MGRSSRTKRERKPGAFSAGFDQAVRAQEYGKRLWNSGALTRFIPPGEKPIATRYHPQHDTIHIACESGKTFTVDRRALELAELEPPPFTVVERVHDSVLVEPKPGQVITVEGSLEAAELLIRDYFKSEAEKGAAEMAGKPQPPFEPSDEDKWLMAEARFDEWMVANDLAKPPICGCHRQNVHHCHTDAGETQGCTRVAEVLVLPNTGGRSGDDRRRLARCRPCATIYENCKSDCGFSISRSSVHPRNSGLDWNPQ